MSKLRSLLGWFDYTTGNLVTDFSETRKLGEWLVDPVTPDKLNQIWESDPNLCVGHRYRRLDQVLRPLIPKGNLRDWVEIVRVVVNRSSYGFCRDGTTLWDVIGVAARTPGGVAPWSPGSDPTGSRWSQTGPISMARDHMAEMGAIIYTASILDQKLVAAALEKYGFGRAGGKPPVETDPMTALMAYDLRLTEVSEQIIEAARKSPCHTLATGKPSRKLAFPTDASALQYLCPGEGRSVYQCGEHWHITTT